MSRKIYRLCCILGIILWVTAGLCVTASANDIDVSFTLVCKNDNTALEGMRWRIYRIGSWENENPVLDGDFAGYPVSLTDVFSAEGMKTASAVLENYAVTNKISYQASGETDENGMIEFNNLEEGLYMVCGKILNINDDFYIPSDIIFEVKSGQGSVAAYPKITHRVRPDSEITHTIDIIWKNDEKFPNDRPSSIIVEIYRDESLHDIVTLDYSNGWSYSWSADGYINWYVREYGVSESYSIDYHPDEFVYTIVNTHSHYVPPSVTAENTEISDSSIAVTEETSIKIEEQLPQTSQLWWPVPLMAGSGLILIAVGLRINSKE